MKEDQKIESRRKFVRAFNSTMIKIWAERVLMLDVYQTGKLYSSIRIIEMKMNADASEAYFEQGFRTYGLWQNYGVGRETPRGNPGDIGRKKVRKKKPWFDRAYYRSAFNIRDFMADSFCQQYIAMFSDAFSDRKLRENATLK